MGGGGWVLCELLYSYLSTKGLGGQSNALIMCGVV